jgi:hypothetical protein
LRSDTASPEVRAVSKYRHSYLLPPNYIGGRVASGAAWGEGAGISTKFHLAITRRGQAEEGFLSGGNVNDVVVAPELAEDVAGCLVIANRGYDNDRFRGILKGNNNKPVIPGRKKRKEPVEYDEKKYKERGYIGRIFGKIKENRRLAVRYENRI